MNTDRPLDRKLAVPRLVGDPDDFLIIAGLAGSAKDIAFLTSDGPNAFLLGGAMGAAVAMGMGLAIARPDRRVLVVTGDGELLMNVGSLATVGAHQTRNLSIVCVDNGHYGETGYQRSHTSLGVDLEQIARGSGIRLTSTVSLESELDAAATLLRRDGPVFVLLRVSTAQPPKYKRSLDAVERKIAFRRSLSGT